MKKTKKNNMLFIICVLLLMGAITLGGVFYYSWTIEQSGLEDTGDMTAYNSHYVLITDNASSPFWKSVYESASRAAADQGAFLELMGQNGSEEHTVEDLMEMSIAASVDGILLQYTGGKRLEGLINEAVEQEIPVITVVDDAPQSMRQSFVGVSSYQLGEAYAQQVVNLMTMDTQRVVILTKNTSEESAQKMISVQISNAVNQYLKQGQKISLEIQRVKSQNPFDTEEAVRNVFQMPGGPPDILLCLDEVDAECAYQAVIDYNEVGKVSIVGYYSTPTIIEGIQKGIIPVTVELDARQIGNYGITALSEYRSEGRVSDYYSIDVNIITQENAGEYTEETHEKL